MLPRHWTRGSSLLVARAAGFGGAGATVATLTQPRSQQELAPSPALDIRSLGEDEGEQMVARAQYRAWRMASSRLPICMKPSLQKVQQQLQEQPQLPLVAEHRPILDCVPLSRPSRLKDDYERFETLGKGGFGIVFGATSRTDGRRFAIKLCRQEGVTRKPLAEARCMAAMPAHDNLVRYYGSWTEEATVKQLSSEIGAVGRSAALSTAWEGSDDSDEGETSELGSSLETSALSHSGAVASGALCLQMELCTAPTLQALLRHEMEHAPRTVATQRVRWMWVVGLARGLEAMHAAGWVHNDLKPANAFCGLDGSAKLGDFGLASPTSTSAASSSQADGVLLGGTAFYLAPERSNVPPAATSADVVSRALSPASVHVSPASDIYSLGICVAEIHGRFGTVMERAAVISALKKVAEGEPADDTAHMTDLEAQELALSMLAPHPAARPSTAHVERFAHAAASVAQATPVPLCHVTSPSGTQVPQL